MGMLELIYQDDMSEQLPALVNRLVTAPPEHLSPDAVALIKTWSSPPTPKQVEIVLSVTGASATALRLLREVLAIVRSQKEMK